MVMVHSFISIAIILLSSISGCDAKLINTEASSSYWTKVRAGVGEFFFSDDQHAMLVGCTVVSYHNVLILVWHLTDSCIISAQSVNWIWSDYIIGKDIRRPPRKVKVSAIMHLERRHSV